VNAAAYCRVSTDRQDTTNQRPALEALARQRGWGLTWFEETASGAKARPVLDDLTARARRGEYAVLVVWAIDRLGRSTWEVCDRVRALDAAGVAVVSHQEPWLDTSGPTRTLLLAVMSWVAEQERARLRERVHAGLNRARRQGKRLGRPRASPLALAAAAALHEGGLSLGEAAKRHGLGRATLARHLARQSSESSQEIGR
jgi:putative DNA-invertase from lambdoid prophage Rac